MEFGIEKCIMQVMRLIMRQIKEEIGLPNHESVRALGEKENYKYL